MLLHTIALCYDMLHHINFMYTILCYAMLLFVAYMVRCIIPLSQIVHTDELDASVTVGVDIGVDDGVSHNSSI
jgi:hypothetical protein